MKNKSNPTYHGCDFLIWHHGQKFYRAAVILKKAKSTEEPYYICLSFSIELFIKCLHTTTEFISAAQAKLTAHPRSRNHSLSELFRQLPKDMKSNCKKQYSEKHTRSLVNDIEHISDVFVEYRYSYEEINDHGIPEIFVVPGYDYKDIPIKKRRELCVSILEDIGAFFYEYSTKVGNFSQAIE